MGVGSVQSVNVRQQDQLVRPDALRHDGRQGIVVTDDDLLGGNRIVFIDDGPRSQLQQSVEGVAEIIVAVLVLHIVAGDQQLGHGMVVFAEELIVGVHQLALAHGGSGLLGGNIRRTAE